MVCCSERVDVTRGFSVTDLYPVALVEGEGMGTAYEYSTKISVLSRFLSVAAVPHAMQVGGLPEAYGLDLGLALFAARHGCEVVVADDRLPVLESFSKMLQSRALPDYVDVDHFHVRHLDTLTSPTREADARFDLWVSTSAIQRLEGDGLKVYLAQVREKSRHAVLLAPNHSNRAHLTISGLAGFRLADLAQACVGAGLQVHGSGYVDMPPFPPGLQRSAEAKERAVRSGPEQLAMRALEVWAHLERFMPRSIQRRWSHLVYVLLSS